MNYDLVNLLNSKIQDLNVSVKKLRHTGEDYAKAYTNYRIALAQELLRLKNEGMPVTIAYDIARGNNDVAHLKFQEIAKEAIYSANKEAINSIKLEIKIIQEQLNKEYGGPDYYYSLEKKESKQLLNYITNLQQENERLKEWKEDLLKENIELENIRKEAIEYINHAQNYETMAQVMPHLKPYVNSDDLLNILQNESDDE